MKLKGYIPKEIKPDLSKPGIMTKEYFDFEIEDNKLLNYLSCLNPKYRAEFIEMNNLKIDIK